MLRPEQFALLIIAAIVVIAGAYFTTYFISSRGTALQRGRLMRVHDRITVTKDNSFCVLEVGGTFYLVGMTPHNVTLLGTLEARTLDETVMNLQTDLGFTAAGGGRFAQVVRDILNKNRTTETTDETSEAAETISVAVEEDDLDLVYRKLQNRRAQIGDLGSDKQPDFESFLQSGDDK